LSHGTQNGALCTVFFFLNYFVGPKKIKNGGIQIKIRENKTKNRRNPNNKKTAFLFGFSLIIV
jgi:hypothetical protein